MNLQDEEEKWRLLRQEREKVDKNTAVLIGTCLVLTAAILLVLGFTR